MTQIRVIKKDGSLLWCDLNFSVIKDDSNNIDRILISFSDISGIKKVEDDAIICKEKLHYANCSIKAAQRIAHLGFLETDLISGYSFWSDELYDMLEIKKGDVEATFEGFLEFVHQDDKKQLENNYNEVLKNGGEHKLTHRIITKNGQQLYVETRYKIFSNEVNGNNRFIGSIFDVDDKVKSEDKLKKEIEKQVKQLREKDEILIAQSRHAAMGEMIGNIAHQWRQPLNMLSLKKTLLVDYYYDGDLSDDLVEEYDNKVDEIVQYMSKTIDDFRNFFSPKKVKEPFGLKKALDDSLNIVMASLKNNYIKLDMYIEDDCEIYGYKNEFQQVVLNIINNAKDAIITAKSEKHLIDDGQIIIVVKYLKDEVFIDITDNAGGIPSDIINKIFDPYFTTKFQSQGTGIGLYMSKMIIEKNMNGRLTARNSDHGACFSIDLKSHKKA
jgi:signal transduction histidine kinase